MGNSRHEVADDGIGIFDLRFSPNFRKRFAGYDKREVELYIRGQEVLMTKLRLEKEQLERQVIRLRQQLIDTREQLAQAREAMTASLSQRPTHDEQRAPDAGAAAGETDPDSADVDVRAESAVDAAASTDETDAPMADGADDAADAESRTDETAEVKAA